MAVQVREIVEKFPEILRLERGPGTHTLAALKEPREAAPGDLIFVSTIKHLETAKASAAQAWVVQRKLLNDVPGSVTVVLSADNVLLAMAKIGQEFFPLKAHRMPIEGPKIAKTAVVSGSAKLGRDVIIGPGAVIGDNCVIGDETVIGANTVIEPGARVGAHCHLHPLVFIGHSCEIGNRCEIHPNTTIGSEGFGYAQDKEINHHRLTHYGRVVLEDDVHIGAGVQIDRGTFLDSRIGRGTKIDNHCHFGHNIQIGRNTLITGGMIVAGSVSIGSYCVIGGRTTVGGHLQIGDKIQIGGLSGITKSVLEPGQYAGFPLQELKHDMRTRASLKLLPDMVKQLREIAKKLGLGDDSVKDD